MGRLAQRNMQQDRQRRKKEKEAEGKTGSKKNQRRWSQLNPDFSFKPHYNRVDGLHLGVSASRPLAKRLSLQANNGYSLALERWSRGLGANLDWGKTQQGWAQVEYRAGTRSRYDSATHSLLLNSAQTLLGFNDYFDYYWNEQVRAQVGYRFKQPQARLVFAVQSEEHTSLAKSTNLELVSRHQLLRPNPKIEVGTLRSARLAVQLGNNYVPFGITRNKRLALEAEYSDDWMESDFSFGRYALVIDWQVQTFLRRRLMPNALDLRLIGGFSSGNLPIQRFAIVDASTGPFTPFGTLRTLRGIPYEGQHYAAAFWEHNFKSAPFELLGLWGLARRGFGLVLHGAVGRTWIDSDRRATLGYTPHFIAGFHHEVGLSLQLYHLLRLDLTRRLDRGGWHFGVGMARFG